MYIRTCVCLYDLHTPVCIIIPILHTVKAQEEHITLPPATRLVTDWWA